MQGTSQGLSAIFVEEVFLTCAGCALWSLHLSVEGCPVLALQNGAKSRNPQTFVRVHMRAGTHFCECVRAGEPLSSECTVVILMCSRRACMDCVCSAQS